MLVFEVVFIAVGAFATFAAFTVLLAAPATELGVKLVLEQFLEVLPALVEQQLVVLLSLLEEQRWAILIFMVEQHLAALLEPH